MFECDGSVLQSCFDDGGMGPIFLLGVLILVIVHLDPWFSAPLFATYNYYVREIGVDTRFKHPVRRCLE